MYEYELPRNSESFVASRSSSAAMLASHCCECSSSAFSPEKCKLEGFPGIGGGEEGLVRERIRPDLVHLTSFPAPFTHLST